MKKVEEYNIVEIFFSSEELLNLILPNEKDMVIDNIMPDLEGYVIKLKRKI